MGRKFLLTTLFAVLLLSVGEGGASGPAKLAGDKLSGLTLALEINSRSLAKKGDFTFHAKFCNNGGRDVLIYRNMDWGAARGVLIRVKPATSSNFRTAIFSHSVPPLDVVSAMKNYESMRSGVCKKFELEGPVATLFPGSGSYDVKGVVVPHANRWMNLQDGVWVLEDGVVESQVLRVVVVD